MVKNEKEIRDFQELYSLHNFEIWFVGQEVSLSDKNFVLSSSTLLLSSLKLERFLLKMENLKFNKIYKITARVTPMEKKIIRAKAQKLNMSVSRFLVDCALGKEVKNLSKEDREMLILLRNYGSHFSRISNLIRDRKDFKKETLDAVREIKKIIEVIKNGQ